MKKKSKFDFLSTYDNIIYHTRAKYILIPSSVGIITHFIRGGYIEITIVLQDGRITIRKQSITPLITVIFIYVSA